MELKIKQPEFRKKSLFERMIDSIADVASIGVIYKAYTTVGDCSLNHPTLYKVLFPSIYIDTARYPRSLHGDVFAQLLLNNFSLLDDMRVNINVLP